MALSPIREIEARPRQTSWPHLIGGVLVPAILVVLYILDIGSCPLRETTGLPCPGCGMTRAAAALLRLDFAEMLAMHPLAPVVLPLVGWLWVRVLLQGFGVIDPTSKTWLARVPGWGWLVCFVILWAVLAVRIALGLHPDL